MLNLFGKAKVNKAQELGHRCVCGELATRLPEEKNEIYFCRKCNKLLYYTDPSPSLKDVIPLNLSFFKKRK